MAIFHSLQFDGVDSLDNDVYITGEAVYNAPERVVEMISIPGRNGAFAKDEGRFENIEVTYPAGAFGNNQADFAKKMRNFRNLMASRKGYCRLVDDYNPDEYRLAVFKNAIEVSPVGMSRAGEFELVFDCKPQRYLMSGEAEKTLTSGDEVYNPTPFEASPLIEATGYGDISFNGKTISLANGVVGEVELWQATQLDIPDRVWHSFKIEKQYTPQIFNSSDTISFIVSATMLIDSSTAPTYTSTNPSASASAQYVAAYGCYAESVSLPVTITAGQATNITNTTQFSWSASKYFTISMTVKTTSSGDVKYSVDFSFTGTGISDRSAEIYMSKCTATSTLDRLGNPTYIDCDLGEAYKINDGEVVGLNQFIDLGSKLPTLAPGINIFTYSNTFTDIKLIPKWWIV